MRVWCVTDRETDQLRTSGMVGVGITIGNTLLNPGDHMDVPPHLIAELQLGFRNGLLSMVEPAALVVPVVDTVNIAVPVVDSSPLDLVVGTVDTTDTAESDNNEQRRRRR